MERGHNIYSVVFSTVQVVRLLILFSTILISCEGPFQFNEEEIENTSTEAIVRTMTKEITVTKEVGPFIFGNACPLPCLDGVVPGITTAREVLEILHQNPYVSKINNSQFGNTGGGTITWIGSSIYGAYKATADYRLANNSIVYAIWHDLPGITLSVLIDQIGKPTNVEAFEWIDDTVGYVIEIIWVDIGFTATIESEDYPLPMIDGSLTFLTAIQVDPINPGIASFLGYDSQDNFLQETTDWNGYQTFNYYAYGE